MSQSAEKPEYSPGLAGVIAGESAICWVDPNAGLRYRGYHIEKLADKLQFEDVAYLLLYGDLPTAEQEETFRKHLVDNRILPDEVVAMLKLLPKDAHPIDVLRTGVSMLGPFDPDDGDNSHDANLRKAARLVSRVAVLVTAGYRISRGEPLLTPPEKSTFAERFFYLMDGKTPEPWKVNAMNIVLALYAEHEFNASTFAARVTVSTLSDIYAGVTSALGTLKGPLHGGANEAAMEMIRAIGKPENVEAWLLPRLAKKDKVMGFGHRVYKTGDSRVPVMRELARELGNRFGETTLVPICEKLEEVMQREKGLCSNLDLYAAPVLHLLGIPSNLDVPVFATSRVAGWCAHIIEQLDHNRIIRPRSLYNGPGPREMK
jgi:2-methylcitrate synthase/citrate synthase II